MTIFGEQIASAKASIEEKGELVQWYSVTPGVGGTPEFPAESIVGTPKDVKLVWLPSEQSNKRGFMIDPTIRQTEFYRYAIMSGDVGFDPKSRDYVVRPNGERLTLFMFDAVAPDGVPIIWQLELIG